MKVIQELPMMDHEKLGRLFVNALKISKKSKKAGPSTEKMVDTSLTIIRAIEDEWERRYQLSLKENIEKFSANQEPRPEYGMLRTIGYRVGKHGLEQIERREILDYLVESNLPNVASPNYIEEWGKEKSAKRIQKLVNVLGGIVAKNNEIPTMEYACSDWESDKNYIIKKYRGLVGKTGDLHINNVDPEIRREGVERTQLKSPNFESNTYPSSIPYHDLSLSSEQRNDIIALASKKIIPSVGNREHFFRIIQKNNNLLRWGTSSLKIWLKETEKNVGKADGLSRYHLTYALRHTGELLDAVKCSNVVEFPRFRFQCTDKLISIIANIRAAVFLDIFEFHNDLELLKKAKITLDKAWATGKSNEVSTTYNRLDSIKRNIEKVDYIKRVNHSYAKWGQID